MRSRRTRYLLHRERLPIDAYVMELPFGEPCLLLRERRPHAVWPCMTSVDKGAALLAHCHSGEADRERNEELVALDGSSIDEEVGTP